jgi:hypothetical protein
VRFAVSRQFGPQLLARAVVFRVLAVAHLCPDSLERIAAEIGAYRPLADIALGTP